MATTALDPKVFGTSGEFVRDMILNDKLQPRFMVWIIITAV